MTQHTPSNVTPGQQGGHERSGGYEQYGGYDQPVGYEGAGGYEGVGGYGRQSRTGGYGPGQAPQTGGYGSEQQSRPVSEMAVSEPTLRWVTIASPDRPTPIGPDDYVLDSFFDARYNSWEVLVLVQPREETEAEEGETE